MKVFQKIANFYFTRKALPYWSVLTIDSLCVFVGVIFAFTLNHGPWESVYEPTKLMLVATLVTLLYMVGFRSFHTYSSVLRYSSFRDLVGICMAVTVGLLICIVLELVTNFGANLIGLVIGDLILTALFAICMMWLIRIWIKTLYDSSMKSANMRNVFIYGAKGGGVAIAKSISSLPNTSYRVRGFVSSEPDMIGKYLVGDKVFAFDENLIAEMKRTRADILMISPLEMDSLVDRSDMLNLLIEEGIKIYVMPNAHEWDGKSNLDVQEMRRIELEDLLPRESITIDMNAAMKMLTGSRVLITGAAGSIGSEIVRQVARFDPSELILIDQAETPMHDMRLMMKEHWPNVKAVSIVADISDKSIMRRIFAEHKPEYVFHAAAYKHVPMMEDNPYGAVINNILGTKVMSDLAVENGTRKFVMVSTDKAVNPTNVMGASKRICEIYVQSLDKAEKDGKVKGNTQFVTTRFGNVLGSNGSVIPIFREQIKKGGPVTVTHPDIIRYFMLIPEACTLVLEAGTMGKGGEIYVFDMGEPVRIVELAERMIKLSGKSNIEIKFTGLREGEKLFEEVLDDKETSLPTFHPKIKIAQVRQYDYESINKEIENLISSAATGSDMETVARMKKLVPEFKSRHSKYEALDK